MEQITHLISLHDKTKTACGLNAVAVKVSSINLTDCNACLRAELKEIQSEENEQAKEKWEG